MEWLEFDLLENRLFADADDITLLVACEPTDRSVASSVNRDLVRIHDWCSRGCMLVNLKPVWWIDLELLTIGMVTCFALVLHYLLTFTSSAWGSTSSSPLRFTCVVTIQRILVFWMVLGTFGDTSVFLSCFYASIVPTRKNCSPCRLLPNVTLSFFSVWCVRLLNFIQIRAVPLNRHRCVGWLCMLYKDHSNLKHCLYGVLPPVCRRKNRGAARGCILSMRVSCTGV